MKTHTKVLFGGIITGLLIIGCANKDDALGVGGKSIDKKALQALSIQGAPNWVLNGGQGDMSAVGIADIINGDLGYARTEALALARDELARQVATEVEGVINRAASVTMGSSVQDAQVSKASEQIIKQGVSQTLSGTKQTDTWITKDATKIFVLIKLNPELKAKLQANVKREINKSSLPSNIRQEAARSFLIR
ncbi:hypothetical protein [Helicobacter hepaticus]|jgi:hypothetical protein|uniref:Lipoprotein n=1 Tax=Helicobacter hepaticus (strain ATCC 51449 / 3B1) TaxID=235279 RepID=Q7VF16_HELHP|nr:hypothetical protein [Helicobacter hepaticus]AAP78460.1 conserved hypothetical protein [Helicobacter hepaticus ATCC 51449]